MTVWELAKQAGVPRSALSRYMKLGLVSRRRGYGAHTAYDEHDVAAVKAVVEAQAQRIECPTCGVMVKSRNNKLHLRSVYHRQAKRIRRLLRQPCISLRGLGHRLGITPERVRQIALRFEGISCRERQTVCTMRRTATRTVLLTARNKLLASLKPMAERYNLSVESVSGKYDGYQRKTEVRINGQLCRYVSMSTWLSPHTPKSGKRKAYVTFRRLKDSGAVFLLAHHRDTNTWFVFPRAAWPATQATFSLDPRQTGAGNCRHDWLNYREAWWLLTPVANALDEKAIA